MTNLKSRLSKRRSANLYFYSMSDAAKNEHPLANRSTSSSSIISNIPSKYSYHENSSFDCHYHISCHNQLYPNAHHCCSFHFDSHYNLTDFKFIKYAEFVFKKRSTIRCLYGISLLFILCGFTYLYIIHLHRHYYDPLLTSAAFEQAEDQLNGCQIFERSTQSIPSKSKLDWHDDSSSSNDIPKIIHFIHYNEQLATPRYLCAIESAARHNPFHKIVFHVRNSTAIYDTLAPWIRAMGWENVVRFDKKVKSKESSLYVFKDSHDRASVRRRPFYSHHLPFSKRHKLPDFELKEIDWASHMNQTPLQSWFESKKYLNSTWVLQNLGNAYRMALLWKYGGTYLDLDIISLNPLYMIKSLQKFYKQGHGDEHQNDHDVISFFLRMLHMKKKANTSDKFLAMQDSILFNNAFFQFAPHDSFLSSLMSEFAHNFQGEIWSHNGPRMVTRTLIKTCGPDVYRSAVRDENLYSILSNSTVQLANYTHSLDSDDASAVKMALKNSSMKYADCKGLFALSSESFYPVQYKNRNMLEEPYAENCEFMGNLTKR